MSLSMRYNITRDHKATRQISSLWIHHEECIPAKTCKEDIIVVSELVWQLEKTARPSINSSRLEGTGEVSRRPEGRKEEYDPGIDE